MFIALVGWFVAPALLNLLGTPGEAGPLALTYLRVIFVALPPSFLMVMMMMGLRGVGDSLTPLWFMVLSVTLDSGLNPVLIAGIRPFPAMGIAGAATAIANYVGVTALILTIYLRDLPIRLRARELGYLLPDGALILTILAKGFPMALQMMVVSVSALAMIGLVNRKAWRRPRPMASSRSCGPTSRCPRWRSARRCPLWPRRTSALGAGTASG